MRRAAAPRFVRDKTPGGLVVVAVAVVVVVRTPCVVLVFVFVDANDSDDEELRVIVERNDDGQRSVVTVVVDDDC